MPEDDNIFNEPGAQTPPDQGTPPPQDDPVLVARLAEAEQRGRANALEEAMRISGTRKQDDPTSAAAPVQLPTNPLELLPAQAREELQKLRALDPAAYAETYSQLSAQLTEMRIQQQAQPIITGQASMIVDGFVSRMSMSEPRKELVPDIVRNFHNLLVGKNLSPLVNFDPARREEELSLRWGTAKAQVLEKAPPPRPTPTLLNDGGGTIAAGGGSGPKKSKAEEDPAIMAMAAKYKFTPEQMKEIEAEYA